jgi:flagellar biosynthesis component FlhA
MALSILSHIPSASLFLLSFFVLLTLLSFYLLSSGLHQLIKYESESERERERKEGREGKREKERIRENRREERIFTIILFSHLSVSLFLLTFFVLLTLSSFYLLDSGLHQLIKYVKEWR